MKGNCIRLLKDGVEVFPAMLSAIRQAEHEILLEMYWFADDRLGRRFAEALSERAQAGLKVLIIYDAFGSLKSSAAHWEGLRQAGCQIYEYHPFFPLRLKRLGLRDHRKLLVIDGRHGFTGGLNLGNQWAPEEEGGGGWRDDALSIEGPVVGQMREIFLHTWERRGRRWFRNHPSPRPLNRPRLRLLANHFRARRSIRNAYIIAFQEALRSICVSNAYFLPDRLLRRSLINAAKRGVHVRILLPGRSDVRLVQLAGQHLYSRLLKAGVEIYHYTGRNLHSKSAVVDRRWSTLGSFNLDYRSWLYNLEINVAIEDRYIGRQMEARFEEDLGRAEQVKLEPWRCRSWWIKMMEWFAWKLRRWL